VPTISQINVFEELIWSSCFVWCL